MGVTNETALNIIKTGTQSAIQFAKADYLGLAGTAVEALSTQAVIYNGADSSYKGVKGVDAVSKLNDTVSSFNKEGLSSAKDSFQESVVGIAATKVGEQVSNAIWGSKKTEPSKSLEELAKSGPLSTKNEVTKQADEMSQGSQQKSQSQSTGRGS